MFDKKIIAMIGQREAHPQNLEFVHKSASYFASQQIVVISGFAKGVDQEAYLGAVEGGGQTIVVLAEGILSAKSAFRKISSSIEEGQVMVLSQFHPNAHWQTGLAMGRNSVVVAMADVTLVGQTKIDGGTMDGAKKGIKLNKPIFVVTNPDTDLSGANLLIKQGARQIELSDNPIEDTLSPVIKACYEERPVIPKIEKILSKPDNNQLELIDLPEIPVKPKKPKKKK